MIRTYLSRPLNLYPEAWFMVGIFITSFMWQYLVSWGHSCWLNMHANTSMYTHPRTARNTNVHPSTTFILFIRLWGLLTFGERPDKSLQRKRTGKKIVKKKIYFLPPSNATRKCQRNRFTQNNRVQNKIVKCQFLDLPLPCTQGSSSPAY